MTICFLRQVFKENENKEALVWRHQIYTYQQLLDALDRWCAKLDADSIGTNQVVALDGDFSPNALALMLALIERHAIVVPLSSTVASQKEAFCHIAQVETIITISRDDTVKITSPPDPLSMNGEGENRKIISCSFLKGSDGQGTPQTPDSFHPLIQQLKDCDHPGLILFSSGSTGKSKAALHDFVPLLEKFKIRRHALRTLTFLLFDHIGGINTLFYTLSNGGCAVTLQERTPEAVCQAIEAFQVELLPTSPTFINLLLMSESWKNFDLSSLKRVTYGTEVMPPGTLQRFHQLFPDVMLQQTYGLSEIGILSSKSKSPDSLFVKIGGSGITHRIQNGILHIKTPSAMLGYLNAPSPFTEDGWFDTGDQVEVDGEYIRILGRTSEIINVGGEKVWPVEVENILLEMDGVEDVAVTGRSNPITGQMVQARVKLTTSESLSDFRKRMRRFCKDRLPPFKIPQQVILTPEGFHGGRFKKIRHQ